MSQIPPARPLELPMLATTGERKRHEDGDGDDHDSCRLAPRLVARLDLAPISDSVRVADFAGQRHPGGREGWEFI